MNEKHKHWLLNSTNKLQRQQAKAGAEAHKQEGNAGDDVVDGEFTENKMQSPLKPHSENGKSDAKLGFLGRFIFPGRRAHQDLFGFEIGKYKKRNRFAAQFSKIEDVPCKVLTHYNSQ